MKDEYDFSKAVVIKGAVKSKAQVDSVIAEQKTLASIRLDKEIVEVAKLRAKEEGPEDRVNKLGQAVFSKKKAI